MRLFKFSFFCSIIILSGFFFTSCKHREDFNVKDFEPLANWQDTAHSTKTIYLDYKGAVTNGFIIPSVRQTPSGKFVFQFSINNHSENPRYFYYKIYYQDESYKFQEYVKSGNKLVEDSLAQENFYGSWEQSTGFKVSDVIPNDGHYYTVKDSFRIVGNPRNEERYSSSQTIIPEDLIEKKMRDIAADVKWYGTVKEKAKKEHRDEKVQLRMDAIWTLKVDIKPTLTNNRWQRNPRVGKYSFMLVVTTEKNVTDEHIPSYIQDISKRNGKRFANPYFYFLYGKGDSLSNTKVLVGEDSLKVIAKPDLGMGIYIDHDSTKKTKLNTDCFAGNCGNSSRINIDAPFEQYFNAVDPNLKLNNIPVVADVTGNEYTVGDYRENKFADNKLIHVPLNITDCPCKTVHSDSVKHTLQLTNPASPEGKWRKEDVGVVSRNGLTYGKYYFKVKMPSLLNKSKLWNGLTDALWLINQDDASWNNRRYAKGGYIPKYENDSVHHRQQLAYSEIDFEILKAAHYWPHTSYHKDAKKIPEETAADSSNIMVTYTNWDMACKDVPHYTVGADSIHHNGKYYGIHRWDDDYKALTGKVPENNDTLFKGGYYYFEIEWNPKEIIWSIGPEKNKMKVIGYVNDTVSSIPNNQMRIVISQEFHFSKWWPNLPFLQEQIPFPSKDILGEIYDIEIE